MENDELHYLELVEVAKLLHERKVSPVEVTRSQLQRIEQCDRKLGSYLTVMAEQAMAEAHVAEDEIMAGTIRGILHGVPVALKDLCWTKGVPTTFGTTIYEDFVPSDDATVVERLRTAGAIILGKLKLTEGAYADHHPTISPPVNPWNSQLWAGTSSSGSGVATAAGLCYGSLGTDTGGSIRFPSAANGVTGLKPTWGRVSRHGVFELAATLDHVGPMARSAADAGAILGVIAGSDGRDPTASLTPVPDYLGSLTRGLINVRVGFDEAWAADEVDEATRAVLNEAIRAIAELGGSVRKVAFPDPSEIIADWFPLCGVEAALAHEKTYPASAKEYGQSLGDLIKLGRSLSGMEHQKMVLRRLEFKARLTAMFQEVDLLLIPVTAMASPSLELMKRWGEEPNLIAGILRYTCPFDSTGSPTITLPGGRSSANGPIAFQLVARHFDEELLTRAGWAFQQITDWHRRHPTV
jgi:amidase